MSRGAAWSQVGAPAQVLPGPPLPPDVVSRLSGRGLLVGPWPALVMGAITVLVLALVWSRARRRRHVGRRRWTDAVGGAIAIAIALALTLAAGINGYAGYAPDLGALAQLVGLRGYATGSLPSAAAAPSSKSPAALPAPGSLSDPGTVISALLGAADLQLPVGRLFAYLPPGYGRDVTRRYPVAYLIHGNPGGSGDWIRAGKVPETLDLLIRRGLVPPMIVVAPDVSAGSLQDSECLNAVGGPQITTFLVRDVVGWADRTLRTVPDRQHRALGGMSSGGFCALDIGLRNQQLFGALLGFEPYGDPGRGVIGSILRGRLDLYRTHDLSLYLQTIPSSSR